VVNRIFGLLIICMKVSFVVIGMSTIEDNFMYQSMIEYREVGRDLLYGRNGVTSIEDALLRERRFLAGNKRILENIKKLEKAAKTDNCFSSEVLDFGIQRVIEDIGTSLSHYDENGDVQYFSLKDKMLAVNEIVFAYRDLSLNVQCYGGFRGNMLFWERFKVLLNDKLKGE